MHVSDHVSKFFGDNSRYADMNVTPYATVWGLYPIGGKYDGGDGLQVTQTTGAQGRTVQKMFTFADLKFIEAEMMLDGTITGDAKATLEEAVKAAFTHLNATSGGLGGAPAGGIAAAGVTTYVDAVLAKFDAASNAVKMEIIMTQKWIHDIMNPFESYTDIRRTGYPLLFDPDKLRYGISPEDKDGEPVSGEDAERNAFCGRPFPNSLWYPKAETDRNPNITQKANQNGKVFWQQ